MMHSTVLVLLSVTNQLALGSPLFFPDEVNVDSDGVWTLKTDENKLKVNEVNFDSDVVYTNKTVEITNTPDKVEQVMLPSEDLYHGFNDTSEIEIDLTDQGEDYLGNKQTNETDHLSLVEDNDPDFLNNGSIKISSNNSRTKKSMEIRVDTALDVPSDDDAEIKLYKNVKRRATGNQIFFPNTRNPVNSSPTQGSGNNQNSPMIGPCRDGRILFQGECSQLLSSKPCGENWWLVMKSHDFAQCEPRPCPLGQIFYQNTCVYPELSTICAEGQILYVEMTGVAFCDCETDYFYNSLDGTCVPEQEQGWCNWGQYIVQNGDGIPVCVSNPCGRDGFVYHEQNNWCYSKTYIGFCEQKHININGNVAECNDAVIDLRNIFEVPTLRRCPRGSLRDILHECRRRFNVPSMPSVLKYKHLNGKCRTGFTKGPRGRCRKVIDLFSMSERRS